jgi:hypothetical protein
VVEPAQLSVPTGGVHVAIAPLGQLGSNTISVGQLIVGAVLSITVTVCCAVPVLLEGSVAVYVIVVVPTGKALPAGTPVRVTESDPAQESLAVAVPRVALLTVVPQEVAPEPV